MNFKELVASMFRLRAEQPETYQAALFDALIARQEDPDWGQPGNDVISDEEVAAQWPDSLPDLNNYGKKKE